MAILGKPVRAESPSRSPKDDPGSPKETAADDDGIVDTTDEVALLRVKTMTCGKKSPSLKILEDAEQRAKVSILTDYKKARRTNMKCARRTRLGRRRVHGGNV